MTRAAARGPSRDDVRRLALALPRVDLTELQGLLTDSWPEVAPKRLLAVLDRDG